MRPKGDEIKNVEKKLLDVIERMRMRQEMEKSSRDDIQNQQEYKVTVD